MLETVFAVIVVVIFAVMFVASFVRCEQDAQEIREFINSIEEANAFVIARIKRESEERERAAVLKKWGVKS